MKKTKNFKTLTAFALTAVTAFSFTGCGKKGVNEDKEVTLKWIMPGPGKQTDSDVIWAKFNEELHKKSGFQNTNVDIEVISTNEYKQKFMLMLTSDEKIDIANTYTLPYADYARDDTFVDISDMIDEYLPDAKKEIPSWVFDMMMVDGKYYAVTSYQQMASAMYSYAFQSDEADKYLDKEKLQSQLLNSQTFTEDIMDTLEDYLKKLKENGELDLGMTPGSTYIKKGYIDLGYNYLSYLPREDGKVVVENFAETDVVKMFMHRYADFFKKGYVREDVLSAEINADKGKKNGYNIWLEQDYKGASESASKKYGFDVTFVQSEPNYHIQLSAAAGGNAVVSTCENPQRALSLLNIMNSSKGKDLYQLLVYGEKDKNYKLLDNGRIEPIGYTNSQGDSNAPYGIFKWIVGNTANAFETIYDPEGWNDYVFNDWNKNAEVPELVGFKFDASGLETEMGQLQTIYSDYIDQVTYGALKDCDATYKEFIGKMKAAGIDKVVSEMQKQVDEFLAKKNNK